MTFLEIFEHYILPAVAVLSGLTALIIFIFSRSDREVTRKKIEAEVEKILAERDSKKAEEATKMQEYWHKEFERLNARIEKQEEKIKSQDQKIIGLETAIKGRDLTIEELTEENRQIKEDYDTLKKSSAANEILMSEMEKRIKALEKLLKKYGIDPDGEIDCDE